jgi:hypothetical protein
MMVACGGGSSSSAPQQTQTFQNHTTSSDAALLSLWNMAQNNLAHNTITLNEALVVTQNAPPVTVPADLRAASVSPNDQVVYGEPDAPGQGQGVIDCSAVNVPLCHGYTTVNGWVYVPDDAINNAEYEFENVILIRLGYDISKR